jgi:nitrous oxidase accessory protein
MPTRGFWGAVAVLGVLSLTGGMAARAATVTVAAQPGALAKAVAAASAGDRLILEPGRHEGPLVLAKPIALEGRPGAEIAGNGQGTVIAVTAPNVTLSNLVLSGSGDRAVDFDSAVQALKGSDGLVIEHCRLSGNLFGIVLRGVAGARIADNDIANRHDLYETSLGNGIHLLSTTASTIEENRLTGGRDGIYSEASHGNSLIGNRMEGVRFAVHAMYSNRMRVIGNRSAGNRIGYALMYSDHIDVERNVSDGDGDEAMMIHTSHHSLIADNLLAHSPERCVFIYTAAKNEIRGNRIQECGIGMHFSGGSEDNAVYENAFIGNRTQVKYSGTVYYEWSKNGRGNYWSDNTAFDRRGTGIAETAYRPNNVTDRLVWRYPTAKLLLAGPVMEALRVAQGQFPALMPGGVIDSHPLMAPPSLPETGS